MPKIINNRIAKHHFFEDSIDFCLSIFIFFTLRNCKLSDIVTNLYPNLSKIKGVGTINGRFAKAGGASM